GPQSPRPPRVPRRPPGPRAPATRSSAPRTGRAAPSAFASASACPGPQPGSRRSVQPPQHVIRSPKAGGQGFEPRFSGPKPDVLPLDDPPKGGYILAARRTAFPRPGARCRLQSTPFCAAGALAGGCKTSLIGGVCKDACTLERGSATNAADSPRPDLDRAGGAARRHRAGAGSRPGGRAPPGAAVPG